MLPALAKMFALVRDLLAHREVAEIPASRWLIQRHNLGPLTALAGATQLRDELAASTTRWIVQSRAVTTLIAQLGEAGVGVAPIKGFAYAAGIYETPAARPMTDVDLFVEPGRELVARRVLERVGFTMRSDVPLHHASMWERGEVTVDLHRNILPVGRSRIAIDEVWARTRVGWPTGARRLEPVDELVFHLAHMARNRLCGPLVQVVDAVRLLEHASAERALARAREWHIHSAIAAALTYCRAIADGRRASWLAPPDDAALFAYQPQLARKLLFDIATAGSASQLGARMLGAGLQRIATR
ncbi:MAG TPA: nucleotidyltransferase family protein [Kofleriaceae bacterium]|jgi:hypothetical protein